MRVRAAIAMILGYLIPGLGHLYLGRRGRALGFFFIITFLFAFGLYIDGALYTLAKRSLLDMLGAVGSMGAGAMYFIARTMGEHGDIRSATYEYGRMFTLSAGLMNLVLMLDCYDIAAEGKP